MKNRYLSTKVLGRSDEKLHPDKREVATAARLRSNAVRRGNGQLTIGSISLLTQSRHEEDATV